MPKQREAYADSHDVIHGFGEVPAIFLEAGGLGWILPGREITQDREQAEHAARRMDAMIQANMKRYDRSLIW